ncbi:MAG: hypothetical protein ACYS5V_00245 [Planctomycetota bacterium]|jgi:hypothetical protein
MEQCLERALGDLVSLAARLNIIPGTTPLPVNDDDVRRWRAAAEGSDAWLVEDRGRSVGSLLRIMRNHRQNLRELAWEAQVEAELEGLDRYLTEAVIGACRGPDWVWLRLKMLRFAQDEAGPGEISALFRSFELDVDALVLVRDAAIVAHATTPDANPQAAVNLADGDEAFARAAASLADTLNARQRQLFVANPEVRAALDRLGVDPDACLAVDAASGYAAQRRGAGDPRTASLVDLISHLLVAGGSAAEVFEAADWEALKQELAAGQTRLLADAADGSRLTRVMLSVLYGPGAPHGVPAHWAQQVEKEYWVPFRRSALRAGATWSVDALCLLAAVHATVDPQGRPHPLAESREAQLRLRDPAGESAGATRLDRLAAAVLDLDADAFHQAVPETQAEQITTDLLITPPHTDPWVRSVLGLEGRSFYERAFDQCAAIGGPGDEAEAKVRVLHELTYVGLGLQTEDSGEFLDALAACPAIGLDKATLVSCVVLRDYAPFLAVPTGPLLKSFIDDGDWLAGLVDVRGWIRQLRDENYEELRLAVGPEVADDPHAAVNLVWKLLTGGADEAGLLKSYEIQRPELEQLVSDFYAGRSEALTRRIAVHLPESAPAEPIRSQPFAAVHVYLALLAALVISYVVLHLYVVSAPPIQPTALPPPETAFESLDSALRELGAVSSGLREHDRPIYVAVKPVTYEEYAALMAVPSGIGGQQVGMGTRKPVHFANHEEAREFCRRLTDYLQASSPGLFSDELDGYVCRLPRLTEAEQVNLKLPAGSGLDGEWIDSPDPSPDARAILSSKPVRMLGAPPARPVMRRRADERTTFRVVLSPTRP